MFPVIELKMSIVLDKPEIEKRCIEFFRLYDTTEDHIHDMCKAKVDHSLQVAETCFQFAVHEKLSKYECDLAWVIGMLHDFGRFGQAAVTKSFNDTDDFDHAKNGAKLLFSLGLIEDIIRNYAEIAEEDKCVIEKAIYYHSAYYLPDELTEREEFFCNIIRQADQLDIFHTIVESGWRTIYGCEKEVLLATEISDDIAAAFYQKKLADYSKRTTLADYHLAHIALCFGLQNDTARKIAIEQGYLKQMMEITFSKPSVQKKYSELKKITLEYLCG